MVNYICPFCKKNFNKKSNYVDHIENKKKPCKEIKADFTPNSSKIPPNPSNNPPNSSNNSLNNKILIQNYRCNFCDKTFSRIDNFKRHLIDRCKVRKEETQEKEAIFQELLKQNELLNQIDSKLYVRLYETQMNLESIIKNIVSAQQITNVVLVVGILTNTFLLLRRR